MNKEWVSIIGSRFVDYYDDLEDEFENIISKVVMKGRGIILSAAPGIDCRALAYLLQNHGDDVDFKVHMEQDSVDEFAEECMSLVDQELLDAEEAQYAIEQIKRLQLDKPDALLIGKQNEEALECGRYASVIVDCDKVFAIHANNSGSTFVEKTIEFANENNVPVTVFNLRRTAA